MTLCSSDPHVHRQHGRMQYVAVPTTNTGEECGSVITLPGNNTVSAYRFKIACPSLPRRAGPILDTGFFRGQWIPACAGMTLWELGRRHMRLPCGKQEGWHGWDDGMVLCSACVRVARTLNPRFLNAYSEPLNVRGSNMRVTAVVECCKETDLYVGYVPGFLGAHGNSLIKGEAT